MTDEEVTALGEMPTYQLIAFLETWKRNTEKEGFIPTVDLLINQLKDELYG